MRKKFALINETTGEVQSIAVPASFNTWETGQIKEGLLVQEIELDVQDSVYLQTKYWQDSQWKDRTLRPSGMHKWTNFEWAVDKTALWLTVRSERYGRLMYTDWTQVADAPLTDEKRAEWAAYRQALRDVPTNNPDIELLEDVVWPTEPS